jgi:hypothetical protein
VKFVNTSFRKDAGLPANFSPSVTTDGGGRYTIKLYAGEYRVVVTPEGSTDQGSVTGAAPPRQWALTERLEVVGTDAAQTIDVSVAPIRVLTGVATAGKTGVVAQGATLEATPLISVSDGVFDKVVSPPITPAKASVPVRDDNGQFELYLDPGEYDMTLKPAAQSNFAWWILPKRNVLPEPPVPARTLSPQLLYPVPLEGTITVGSQPLRNATVQAYARAPSPLQNVVKVGIARTDDTGHYYLALPPTWGDP